MTCPLSIRHRQIEAAIDILFMRVSSLPVGRENMKMRFLNLMMEISVEIQVLAMLLLAIGNLSACQTYRVQMV